MKLINEAKDDFSLEVLAILGAVQAMGNACEIAAERLSAVLDSWDIKGTLIQQQKRYIKAANRSFDSFLHNLEAAYDKAYSEIITSKGNDYIADRDETMHGMAAEMLRLAIMYVVKSEGMDNDKRQNIFKMMGNFKDSGTIDLQGILKFFRFDG